MTKKNNNSKGRNWAFVVYPESLPKNWLEILQFSGLKIAVSPLHDADKNADETEKKPHYHIIAIWEGPTTYNNALNFSKQLNGTIPIRLEQIRGYYRYLTHKDNPEKAQYDEKDIIKINGFDINDFVEFSKSEIDKMKREIYDLINKYNIVEYDDLFILLDKLDRFDLWIIASNHTIFFSNVLKSKRHKKYNYDYPKYELE